jgi:hypothetical protein
MTHVVSVVPFQAYHVAGATIQAAQRNAGDRLLLLLCIYREVTLRRRGRQAEP